MTKIEVIETQVGPLQSIVGSGVGENIRKRGQHDPGVQYFMERHRDRLFPFFDVGANIGLFAILAAQMGGPVFAFEPDENNLSVLKANIESTGTNVTVFPVAIAEKDGVIAMGVLNCGRSAKATDNRIELPARSIQSVSNELGLTPSFIKIDIEGGETAALLGMEGPEFFDTILELEFSWRDHGQNIDDWLRIRPTEKYRWDFLLSPTEIGIEVEPVEINGANLYLASSAKVPLREIFEVLEVSTQERPSRKWELCITPIQFS